MADFMNFVEEKGLEQDEEEPAPDPDDEARELLDEGEDEAEEEGPGDEEPPEEEDEDGENKARALQLDHKLDKGKFHVGASWILLDGLTGSREKYNGVKCLVTSFGIKNPAKVKVKSQEKISPSGKNLLLWVYRINCRNTVHKSNQAWDNTENVANTGATGAARWVALGRSEVDAMQGKLNFGTSEEDEAFRTELFAGMDVNGNDRVSLAELDKALPELMGCVALFNAKPAIIRAFLAATGKDPERNDAAAFRDNKSDYIHKGEQFRLLMQYLHEYFEMYLIFQDMCDADEDRRIDCKEWAEFITSGKAARVGIKVTPEMLEDVCGETPMPGYSLFNEIDTDQGGCILFKEFSDYCIRKGLEDPERIFKVAQKRARGLDIDAEDEDAPLLVGPEDASMKMRLLFSNVKDMPSGITIAKFRKLISSMGGLDDDEIDVMVEATDVNGSGVIEPEEFVNWLFGDDVDDEDREALAG
mmetsp:Transcript_25362/g.45953  ORF Transcript_25362/g.45953 Transcript_25362/m.45953 type:complete len:473 (+) Transcript_25362:122-1540(+)|eukprot:CAMPEP_0197625860 /NCGR_PEP_ID=MMETSP1338-20131121/5099_1 /TAXON_ID=43686 ORGANISM="Pelagodinium beii, Strain RCC1491" /NCGR_SAMPLE_ID=MMETSP1338 /ASSEMBLY_ACC=CAM_ASM_000754 /LENGTH=472 /DNA_ID=CAMNT_0043196365 /DNA_START=54 /DNA_END=1472 /DNA_ORIENTATION=-